MNWKTVIISLPGVWSVTVQDGLTVAENTKDAVLRGIWGVRGRK
jgi:hypothetical protein